MGKIWQNIHQSVKMCLWMTLLTGIVYPILISSIALIIAPQKASGDLLIFNDKVIGSRLIAQQFTSDGYFWPRPSAIHYNPLPSGGSNLGPTSITLKKEMQKRAASLAAKHHVTEDCVPIELLFTTGSGLDPHICPDTAYFQIARVARARGLDPKTGESTIRKIIDDLIEKPFFGFIGIPHVNVLLLNKQLDRTLHE